MADWEPRICRLMRSNPAEWTDATLTPLSIVELQALCELMGIPHSGTKEKLIERLLTAAELRHLLKDVQKVEDLLHFKGKELRAMCRRAGCFLGVCKRSSAASLLNWRNNCRQRGQAALKAAREEAQKRPPKVQGVLF